MRKFSPQEVKQQLGLLNQTWGQFIHTVRSLTQVPVTPSEVKKFVEDLFCDEIHPNKPISRRAAAECQALITAFNTAPGQQLAPTKGTAWELVNAVSFHVDHVRRSTTRAARLDSAWFGSGAALKQKAWQEALALAGNSKPKPSKRNWLEKAGRSMRKRPADAVEWRRWPALADIRKSP